MSADRHPLLSICIPTHNRAGFLSTLLQSIRCQPAGLDYEVRVRDNASTDDTRPVFARVAASAGHWFYDRNETNLGGRANIRLCTEKAQGKYVWIVGDDDCTFPDTLDTVQALLRAADRAKATAIFCNPRLGPKYAKGAPFPLGFEWLRRVSVNVPAFISSVIWERGFWTAYPYELYPPEMSLPQLDCFVEACLRQTVLGYTGRLVQTGHAEPTDKPSFWFYTRHAPVACFEYPALYSKILKQGRLDACTRLMVRLRRVALLREIFKKALFFRHNEHHFRTTIAHFRPGHAGTFYWPFLRLMLWLVLTSRIGKILADKRYRGIEPLPMTAEAHPTCGPVAPSPGP